MSLPDGVQPVPAANARSPNRQPRYRRAVNQWLREKDWQTYLRVYAQQGRRAALGAITTPCISQLETDEAIHASAERIRRYMEGHPERIGQLADVKAAYHQRLQDKHEGLEEQIQPRLDGLVDESLGVEAEVLGDKSKGNAALRHDAAKTILKGAGVLTEKHKVDLQVKDFQITVRYADSDSDKGTDGNTPATP